MEHGFHGFDTDFHGCFKGDADQPRQTGTRRLDVPKASLWESYAEGLFLRIPSVFSVGSVVINRPLRSLRPRRFNLKSPLCSPCAQWFL